MFALRRKRGEIMAKIFYLMPLLVAFTFAGCGEAESPSGKTEKPSANEGARFDNSNVSMPTAGEKASPAPEPKTSSCAEEGCTWNEAASYCDGKLPTVDQLQKIRANECQPGKPSTACIKWYWSSEEENASYAKMVMLLTGAVTPGGKNGKAHARCLPASR